MTVWEQSDYLIEAEKKVSDKIVYKEVNFNEKLIQDLTETRSKMFRCFKEGRFITNKVTEVF